MTDPHPDERARLANRIRRVLRSSQELYDLDEEVERLTALLLDATPHPRREDDAMTMTAPTPAPTRAEPDAVARARAEVVRMALLIPDLDVIPDYLDDALDRLIAAAEARGRASADAQLAEARRVMRAAADAIEYTGDLPEYPGLAARLREATA